MAVNLNPNFVKVFLRSLFNNLNMLIDLKVNTNTRIMMCCTHFKQTSICHCITNKSI